MILKVARRGFDARTTGDENLLYSSLWPLLKIYKQGQITINKSLDYQITTHDLGFVPAFWIFTNEGFSTYNNYPSNVGINDRELVWKTSGGTGSTILYYYIFALDITKEFIAPITKTGGEPGGADTKHSFKVAKPGKSIKDRLVDQIISTEAQSFLIHSVNCGKTGVPQPSGAYAFTAYHALNYAPIFFPYRLNTSSFGVSALSGYYSILPTGQGGADRLFSDNQKVQYDVETVGGDITFVICKDPFTVRETIKVSI